MLYSLCGLIESFVFLSESHLGVECFNSSSIVDLLLLTGLAAAGSQHTEEHSDGKGL